jgi:type IV pilus assembly protein PilW
MTTRHRQAGLSLIELMISMTLGLIILSGVLVVFVNASTARNEVERTSRQIENGRYASELLTDDIRLAGFYGELDVSTISVPAELPSNPCSLVPDPDWKNWIPIHLQGFDDTAFTSANCTLTDLKPGTDVLVVRRARACLAGSTGCDAAVTHKAYLQVALCSDTSQAATFRLGLEGTITFDRQKRSCSTTSLAEKRQYMVHVYFVSTNNGQGEQIPTLKRLELTATGTGPRFEEMPLVEGIEEFQLHYGVDTNNDGAPDFYAADPSVVAANYLLPPDPPTTLTCTVPLSPECKARAWSRVVTVQFHLLARNIDTSPNYTDAKTYHLGNKADGSEFRVTPGGAYRRHIYTGLVRVANPAGRRDAP